MFKAIFGRKNFRLFHDSFAMTKAKKLETLCQWCGQQAQRGETVLVLAHFPSSFMENQDALMKSGLDFEIFAERMNPQMLTQWLNETDRRGQIFLSIAQMLEPTEASDPLSRSSTQTSGEPKKLSVIVTERYPLVSHDERLETFFRSLQAKTSMGYLIAFDDPLVVGLLGQRFVDLMEQLGFNENELISSAMTYRGLARKIRKATASVTDEKSAESPEEWIALNGLPTK